MGVWKCGSAEVLKSGLYIWVDVDIDIDGNPYIRHK